MMDTGDLVDCEAEQLLADRLFRELVDPPHGGENISRPEFDQAVAQAVRHAQLVVINRALGRRTCKVCGCWELEACEEGCGWAATEICTACLEPAEELLLAGDEPGPLPAKAVEKGRTVRLRVDMSGALRNAAEKLRDVEHPLRGLPAPEDKEASAAFLDQMVAHIEDVRDGRASMDDFADFYCLTPRVAAMATVCIDCLGQGGDAGSRHNPCPTCGKMREGAHG